jgi:vacuolar-type H+-ATPase subunit E/Vma4
LLKQALSTGNEVVLPAEGEKHLDQQLLDQANQQSDKTTTLQLSQEKVPGSGGFLLAADKIRTRVTWEVLLKQARREFEPKLAKILFPASQAPEQ